MRGVLSRVPIHDDAADKPVRILHRCKAVSMILKKSVEFNSAENIQHKLDNPIGAMGAI
jgi:hypothetical protein